MKLRVTRKQIALCLVAGVVTTAGVALLGTMFGKRTRYGTTTSASEWPLFEHERVGVSQYWLICVMAEYLDTELADDPDWAWEQVQAGTFDRVWPATPMPSKVKFRTWGFFRSGWPFAAFRGWDWLLLENAASPTGRISKRSFAIVEVPLLRYGRADSAHFMLPYYPLWPGFIANTLIYAALWWLLFTGLIATRAARRDRRGLCPRCAYDLRGVSSGVCPECGEARPT